MTDNVVFVLLNINCRLYEYFLSVKEGAGTFSALSYVCRFLPGCIQPEQPPAAWEVKLWAESESLVITEGDSDNIKTFISWDLLSVELWCQDSQRATFRDNLPETVTVRHTCTVLEGIVVITAVCVCEVWLQNRNTTDQWQTNRNYELTTAL